MEISFIWLLWISTLVFTVCSFIWRDQVFFPMISGVFWFALAMSFIQVHYIGYGSTNIIVYDSEQIDDNIYGMRPLMYLFAFTGIMMWVYGLYAILKSMRKDIPEAVEGNYEIWDKS